MKKFAVCILVCSLLIGIVVPACYAGPARKLGRGLGNVITFPCEIWYQVNQANKEHGPVTAMSYGVLKGVFMAVARAVTGVYEVATFPIPAPDCYEPIMKDPEFFFPAQ